MQSGLGLLRQNIKSDFILIRRLLTLVLTIQNFATFENPSQSIATVDAMLMCTYATAIRSNTVYIGVGSSLLTLTWIGNAKALGCGSKTTVQIPTLFILNRRTGEFYGIQTYAIQLHRICAIPSSSISTLLVIDSTQ